MCVLHKGHQYKKKPSEVFVKNTTTGGTVILLKSRVYRTGVFLIAQICYSLDGECTRNKMREETEHKHVKNKEKIWFDLKVLKILNRKLHP